MAAWQLLAAALKDSPTCQDVLFRSQSPVQVWRTLVDMYSTRTHAGQIELEAKFDAVKIGPGKDPEAALIELEELDRQMAKYSNSRRDPLTTLISRLPPEYEVELRCLKTS
ncbi:unnamed protein product, partial [Laminaria digitata]